MELPCIQDRIYRSGVQNLTDNGKCRKKQEEILQKPYRQFKNTACPVDKAVESVYASLNNVHYITVCCKTQRVFTENSQKFFRERI